MSKFSDYFSDLWEELVDEITEMKILTILQRFYKNRRVSVQIVCVTSIVILLGFFLKRRGYFSHLARKAVTFENAIASKVEQIANQFDDILSVSFRKASWELVQDNVGVYAMQGRRMSMEDRFTFVNRLDHTNTSIYGVFDGHGGELASGYVEKALLKKLMMKLLVTNLHNSGDDSRTSIEDVLQTSILEVDKSLLSLSKTAYDNSGCTALVAIVHDNVLYVANVGDSRAVMCDHQLTAIPLSYDHKPDLPEERTRIENAGGFVTFFGVWRVNGILATSRAMGDLSLKHNDIVIAEPDIRVFQLSEHKPLFMILATDGLWDVFSNEEAVRFVHNHITEVDFGAKKLVGEAFTRGSLDNISVIIVNFSAKPAIESRSPMQAA